MNSLHKIIQSIFVLCLDKSQGQPSNNPSICEDPVGTISVNQMLHGGGSNLNSCNRWFDKIFQVPVVYFPSSFRAINFPFLWHLLNFICRNLKHDFRDTIKPMCLANDDIEDTEHSLLPCPSFIIQRRDLFTEVLPLLQPFGHITLFRQDLSQLLMYSEDLPD